MLQNGGVVLKQEGLILILAVFLALAFIPACVAGQMDRFQQDGGAPEVGDVAPTFKLKTLGGQREVDIKKLIGKKPIILIFGSYT